MPEGQGKRLEAFLEEILKTKEDYHRGTGM